jgi:serine/threonine-protein phosphatase 2A regulatory subunit B
MTGSYHNYLWIFGVNTTNNIVFQADKSAFKQKKMGQMGKNTVMNNAMRPAGLKEQMNLETLEFNEKIVHGSGILTKAHSR